MNNSKWFDEERGKYIWDYDQDDINEIIKSNNHPNWFQRLPLHLRYLYYMIGGIVVGYLIRIVQEIL